MNSLPRCILILYFLLLPLGSISQTLKIDSLKKVLLTLPPEGRSYASDTVRLVLSWQIANELTNQDTSLTLMTKCVTLANKLAINKWKAFAFNRLGLVLFRKQLTYSAVNNFFKGLSFAEKANLTVEKAWSWRYIGDSYHSLGDNTRSINAYQTAIKLYLQTNEPQSYLMCLNNLGFALRDAKKYEEAVKILLKCQAEATKLNNHKFIKYAQFNLASTYERMGRLSQAIKIYEKVLLQNKDHDAYTYSELAKLLMLNNQKTKSINMARSVEKKVRNSWPTTAKYVYQNLYSIYKLNNEAKKALNWYEKFIALKDSADQDAKKKQIEALRFEYENEKQLVNINLLKKENEIQNYQSNFLIGGLLTFLLVAGILFWINNKLKYQNSKISIQHQELIKIRYELEQSNNVLNSFNESLEERVIERTIELQKANQELLTKNLEIEEALIKGKTIERKRVASELHDNLGSTISGLIWQLEGIASETLMHTEQYIYIGLISQMREAYSEIRHISHNLMPVELEKNGLIPAIQKLINDLNKNEKIRFNVIIEDEIQPISKKIEVELYSTCLELINNIIKHSKANTVILSFFSNSQYFGIKIIDDGIGFELNKNNKPLGKGIENIRQRLKDIGAEFKITSSINKGTITCINYPISMAAS